MRANGAHTVERIAAGTGGRHMAQFSVHVDRVALGNDVFRVDAPLEPSSADVARVTSAHDDSVQEHLHRPRSRRGLPGLAIGTSPTQLDLPVTASAGAVGLYQAAAGVIVV